MRKLFLTLSFVVGITLILTSCGDDEFGRGQLHTQSDGGSLIDYLLDDSSEPVTDRITSGYFDFKKGHMKLKTKLGKSFDIQITYRPDVDLNAENFNSVRLTKVTCGDYSADYLEGESPIAYCSRNGDIWMVMISGKELKSANGKTYIKIRDAIYFYV